MVDLGAEKRFKQAQDAVLKAQDYLSHGRYAQAASALRYARGIIPKGQKVNVDPFASAYRSLKAEIKLAAPEVFAGLERTELRNYHSASDELGRLVGLKTVTAVDGTEAKKKIKIADEYASQFTGTDFPAGISVPMRERLKRVGKLKTELEIFATKNGLTVDWSKD